MRVAGDLLNSERLLLRARQLPKLIGRAIGPCTHMKGYSARKIWQLEGLLAVPAISGADQLKQHVVFRDRQRLPLTKHPSRRSEVSGKHPDLTYVWLTHL